ncbi:MRP8-like protein [Lachancea thermotolerans]
MSDEVAKLKSQVEELQQLVKKQNLLISKTGQSVLELQLAKQKTDVEEFDSKFAGAKSGKHAASHGDNTDYATNEDLVQLVGELQGQLDSIEERSIRRLVNSTKSEKKDYLAPLPNADGEIPSATDSIFPESLEDFENITNVKLFKLAKYYELLPPSLKEQEKFEDYLEGKLDNFHINDMTDEDVEKELKNFSEDQLVEAFNDVARYLGVKSRRGTDIW